MQNLRTNKKVNFLGDNIKGKNFSRLVLNNANFEKAQAGIEASNVILILLFTCFLSALSGSVFGISSTLTLVTLVTRCSGLIVPITFLVMVCAVTFKFHININRALTAIGCSTGLILDYIQRQSLIACPIDPSSSSCIGLCNPLGIPYIIAWIIYLIANESFIQSKIRLNPNLNIVIVGIIGSFLSFFTSAYIDSIKSGLINSFVIASSFISAFSSAYIGAILGLVAIACSATIFNKKFSMTASYLLSSLIFAASAFTPISLAFVDTKAVATNGSLAFGFAKAVMYISQNCLPGGRTHFCSYEVVIASILICILLCFYISWRVLVGDPRYTLITNVVLRISTVFGTSFRGTDLTGANFTGADLANTDFRDAILTRTRFLDSRNLHKSLLYGTILSNSKVRNLLTKGDCSENMFDNLNLRGANLEGFDLKGVSIFRSVLSEATFKHVNLSGANLAEAQALSTNFEGANLTGACIANWNIDNNTNLEEVVCEYIYLKYDYNSGTYYERRPSSSNFLPGEFGKLVQKPLETFDLVFENIIKWNAFEYSFNNIQVKNEGVRLAIQSIENKGDGVVVIRVSVPPEADTIKIHSDFMRCYKSFEAMNHMTGQQNRIINTGGGNYIESNTGTYVQGDFISMSQNLTQAAAQIQDLLNQLHNSGVPIDVASTQIAQDLALQVESNPSIRDKLLKWGQSLGDAAISATISDVVKGVVKLAIRSAGLPLP
ncbi:pentapeptide repeat-containing protein [Pseudanabaena sp. PCC 6802]|uniref:pentapeptide repeat-containing protein n=1 Tax=Pseudanabaena sp. PCC 6802 TaxID=118173 RepID=UPI000348EDC5|nr:pentapeptide repeat-containing protein [Pseudanabaena sp. PCC 6802]